MKIIQQFTTIELPETLEEDAKKYCEKPYRILRREENDIITWHGYFTIWKYENGGWTSLRDYDYTPCTVPEYEKMYLRDKNLKLLKDL